MDSSEVYDPVLDRFMDLFRGRDDAYGLIVGKAVRAPVTAHVWRAHLYGEGSLGVYPTVPCYCLQYHPDPTEDDPTGIHLHRHRDSHHSGPSVRWACTDIDTHGPRAMSPEDALVAARNVQAALKVLGHRGWVEVTKSGGYHVWLFADGWVPAPTMRNVLLLAHQLADVPAIEVNPKDAEGKTELGNYVNLPYANAWAQRGQRVMVDAGGLWPVTKFVTEALQSRSSRATLDETARLYVPPPPRAPVTLRPFSGALRASQGAGTSKDVEDGGLRQALELLNGKGFVIWRDGPNEGGRGFTLFRLGVECRESGLSPDQAMDVLVDADLRWGKYLSGVDGHRDGIKYIEKIVEDVYG